MCFSTWTYHLIYDICKFLKGVQEGKSAAMYAELCDVSECEWVKV